MYAEKLLHKLLKKSAVIGHEKRLHCLLKAVDSVTHQGKLSLTSIGRHLRGSAKVKHKIKSINNLLGNSQLMRERENIYQVISEALLEKVPELLILVDWSPCGSQAYQLLKASVVLQGRSMTLYEEVHPEKKLGNYKVHQQFLAKLKEKIPKGSRVTIETDAGFRTEWFDLVLQNGWDFIGRVRSNMLVQFKESKEWIPCLSLYTKATARAKYLGDVVLAKSRSLVCSLYLYHEKKFKPKKFLKPERRSRKDARYSRSNTEPWLLVTSVKGSQKHANPLIGRYRKRMKIEHEFRQTKNSEWGIGLEYSRTKNAERLQILLLIGYLALFILWMIGLAAEQKKLHYGYQANTLKKHRVLSLTYLGLQIILHNPHSLDEVDIIKAFNQGRISCI